MEVVYYEPAEGLCCLRERARKTSINTILKIAKDTIAINHSGQRTRVPEKVDSVPL